MDAQRLAAATTARIVAHKPKSSPAKAGLGLRAAAGSVPGVRAADRVGTLGVDPAYGRSCAIGSGLVTRKPCA